MLIEWMKIFYRELKGFYDLYVMIIVVSIGLFNLFFDYKTLEKKKLKKQVKLCRFIGAAYVIGGIGLFVIVRLF